MLRTHLCAYLTLLAVPCLGVSATVHFSNHTQTCVSCGEGSVYHADFNNDAYEDLVYINSIANGGYPTFVVKFADKKGGYTSGTSYSIPDYQGSTDSIAVLALGDFTHSGSIDIMALSVDSGKAYLFRNNGKGVFTLGNSFQYVTAGGVVSANDAVVGDFNHDQNPDLAVVSSGQLHLWLGDGKGGFTSGVAQSVNGSRLAVSDFDGDGKADLLIYADPARISSAYVYYGDGTGHFPDEVTLSLPSGSTRFSVGDVNSDGKGDVMAVDGSYAASRVFVFYGDAARKLASHTSILVGRCVTDNPAQVADLDGNGLNDLIVEEADCGKVYDTGPLYLDVLTRNPDSSYNPDQTIYWAQKAPDGNVYSIGRPVILRADQDQSPDLFVTQCADSYCGNQYNTNMLNTTSGNWVDCSAPWAAEGISVCSPLNGQASSPVRFQIGAAGPVPMRDVEVWVDGSKRAEQIDGFSYYTFLDRSVSLTPGNHNVTVFAAGWDQSLVRKSFTISVQ